jgi:hypothetical protein
MSDPDFTTLIIRLPNREAGRLLLRVADLQPIDFPITEPWGYPEPGEAWVRVRIKTSLLPPLDHPLDGDSCYRLDLATLRQAREILVVPREELIQHAIARLDRPRLVSDFPFGRRETDHTWREAIKRGEIANPVWLEAHRRGAPSPAPAPPPPPAPPAGTLGVRPPNRAPRAIGPDDLLRVRRQCLIVRWELLQLGELDARRLVADRTLFDPAKPLHGIPADFLHVYRDGAPDPDAELRQGVMLLLYLLHAASIGDDPDANSLKRDPMRDVQVADLVRHAHAPDPLTATMVKCVLRAIGAYDTPLPTLPPEDPFSASIARQRQRLADDRAWIYETLVLDFFRRRLPPSAHSVPAPADLPPSS